MFTGYFGVKKKPFPCHHPTPRRHLSLPGLAKTASTLSPEEFITALKPLTAKSIKASGGRGCHGVNGVSVLVVFFLGRINNQSPNIFMLEGEGQWGVMFFALNICESFEQDQLFSIGVGGVGFKTMKNCEKSWMFNLRFSKSEITTFCFHSLLLKSKQLSPSSQPPGRALLTASATRAMAQLKSSRQAPASAGWLRMGFERLQDVKSWCFCLKSFVFFWFLFLNPLFNWFSRIVFFICLKEAKILCWTLRQNSGCGSEAWQLDGLCDMLRPCR